MVIVYYFHDSAPEATATCNLDEHLLAWRMKRRKTKLSKKWDEALGKGVLIFSDQQLITLHYITGTGILGSGFSQLSCGISSYYWQIISNCLSSLVFVTDPPNYDDVYEAVLPEQPFTPIFEDPVYAGSSATSDRSSHTNCQQLMARRTGSRITCNLHL